MTTIIIVTLLAFGLSFIFALGGIGGGGLIAPLMIMLGLTRKKLP
jgi:uncharacterized membrane protein YfcA